jgi:inorganic pyrophosphatase
MNTQMPSNLFLIPHPKDFPNTINAVVEIPKGTNIKYEYNHIDGYFSYDRCLLSPMIYPSSYGFVPRTLAEDKDPLDILIYNGAPISRGTVVRCRPLGYLSMIDNGEVDHKILAVPVNHIRNHQSLKDIDGLFLKLCENFFANYKSLSNHEHKEVSVGGWKGKKEAIDLIHKSIIR